MAKFKFPRGYLRDLARTGYPDQQGCWLWPGSVDSHGYGMVTSDTRRQGGKKMDRVHRVCYEALVGPIPDNQVLDHLCYTPRCFNPSHMLPATHKANCENKTGLDVRNKSGFRGVYWDSSQSSWRACVRHNGRLHYAGRFATPEEAGQAALELRQNLQFRDSTTLMS